jgi:hypothetical protein
MPESAERALVGGARAGHAGDQRGVEGVALRAVAPLAGAAVFALIGRGFLHGEVSFTTGRGPGVNHPAGGNVATTRSVPLSGMVAPITAAPS